MPIAKAVKLDLRAAKKIRLRLPWWGVLCAIVGGLPVVWLFDHFGELNLFLPTFNCIAVFAFAIVVKRDLRRQTWFWGAMAILAALHVLAILYIPWGDKWIPALAIAGIDSVDLIIIFAILDAIAKYINRTDASHHGRMCANVANAQTAVRPRPSRGSRTSTRP